MLIAVLIGGVALLAVLLAAVRAPGVVRDHPAAWAKSEMRHGTAPTQWSGQHLGLPPNGPNSLASIGSRFWGSVIDALVVSPMMIIGLLARHTRLVHRVDPSTGVSRLRLVSNHSSVLVSLLLLAPAALYTVGLIATRGQTIGEMAMRIRVARRGNGAVPGWAVSVRRYLLPLTPAIIRLVLPVVGAALSLITLLDVLWALWDPNRQCLHDKIADTLVVNTS